MYSSYGRATTLKPPVAPACPAESSTPTDKIQALLSRKIYDKYFTPSQPPPMPIEQEEDYIAVLEQVFVQQPPSPPRPSSAFANSASRKPFDSAPEAPAVGYYKPRYTLQDNHTPGFSIAHQDGHTSFGEALGSSSPRNHGSMSPTSVRSLTKAGTGRTVMSRPLERQEEGHKPREPAVCRVGHPFSGKKRSTVKYNPTPVELLEEARLQAQRAAENALNRSSRAEQSGSSRASHSQPRQSRTMKRSKRPNSARPKTTRSNIGAQARRPASARLASSQKPTGHLQVKAHASYTTDILETDQKISSREEERLQGVGSANSDLNPLRFDPSANPESRSSTFDPKELRMQAVVQQHSGKPLESSPSSFAGSHMIPQSGVLVDTSTLSLQESPRFNRPKSARTSRANINKKHSTKLSVNGHQMVPDRNFL